MVRTRRNLVPPPPLFIAIREGDLEKVKSLLGEYRRQLLDADNEEQQQDVDDGDLLTQMLEPEGGDPEAPPPPAWLTVRVRTVLHEAVAQANIELLRYLLDELEGMGLLGRLINLEDPKGQTALVEVANSDDITDQSQVDRARLLLQKRAKFLSFYPYRTALHAACSKGNLKMAQLFVEKNTKLLCEINGDTFFLTVAMLLNCSDGTGARPLHVAASNGHLDVVKFLVEIGAEIRAMEMSGATPIEGALLNRHIDIARFLLENLQLDEETKAEFEPPTLLREYKEVEPPFVRLLRVASVKGYEEELKIVLAYCGEDALTEQDCQGRIALHWACDGGHLNIVKLIVETKTVDSRHINLADEDGCTPIRCAVDHPSIVDYLVDHGARDPFGRLVSAVHEANCDKIEDLLSTQEIDVNCADEDGETALRAAAGLGLMDVVKTLLNAGANINGNIVVEGDIEYDDGFAFDELHRTPLDRAIENEQFEIIKFLIDCGADVNIRGHTPMPLFHATSICCDDKDMTPARKDRFIDTIRLLLRHGAELDALDNCFDESVVAYATRSGDIDLVRLFVEEGAAINQKPIGQAKTPLIHASMELNMELVHYLLDNGADPNLANALGCVPLHYACHRGDRDQFAVFHHLLARGANILARDVDGDTCVDLAPASQRESVQAIVDLVEACQERNVDRAEALIQDDRIPGQVKHFTENPRQGLSWSDFVDGTVRVSQACTGGDNAVLDLYKQIDALSLLQQPPSSEEFTLHFVSRHGLAQSVEALIAKNANLNLKQQNGQTALSLAAEAGHVDVAKCLLLHHADINLADNLMNTPLHYASREGHLEIVKLLLKAHDCNAEAMNWLGESALNLAMNCGHQEIESLLIACIKSKIVL